MSTYEDPQRSSDDASRIHSRWKGFLWFAVIVLALSPWPWW